MRKKIGSVDIYVSEYNWDITVWGKHFFVSIAPTLSWWLLPTIEVCSRYVGVRFLCFFLRTD